MSVLTDITVLDPHTGFSGDRSFKNFRDFCEPHSQRLSVVNEAEVDVFFLKFSFFLHYPTNVGNFISGSSAFFESSLYVWEFSVHVLWNLA